MARSHTYGWTPQALECEASGGNCFVCSLAPLGYNQWIDGHQHCHMAQEVSQLKANKVAKPREPLKWAETFRPAVHGAAEPDRKCSERFNVELF